MAWQREVNRAALTQQEAEAAIYIDFETRTNEMARPSALGVLGWPEVGDFRQFVLQPVLRLSLRQVFLDRQRIDVVPLEPSQFALKQQQHVTIAEETFRPWLIENHLRVAT